MSSASSSLRSSPYGSTSDLNDFNDERNEEEIYNERPRKPRGKKTTGFDSEEAEQFILKAQQDAGEFTQDYKKFMTESKSHANRIEELTKLAKETRAKLNALRKLDGEAGIQEKIQTRRVSRIKQESDDYARDVIREKHVRRESRDNGRDVDRERERLRESREKDRERKQMVDYHRQKRNQERVIQEETGNHETPRDKNVDAVIDSHRAPKDPSAIRSVPEKNDLPEKNYSAEPKSVPKLKIPPPTNPPPSPSAKSPPSPSAKSPPSPSAKSPPSPKSPPPPVARKPPKAAPKPVKLQVQLDE